MDTSSQNPSTTGNAIPSLVGSALAKLNASDRSRTIPTERRPNRASVPNPAKLEFDTSDEELKSSTIMIVDDEPLNAKVVQKHLRDDGYSDFVTISDATMAMKAIAGERPDIVLLDVMMPEINGLEILARIRTSDLVKQTPVVILTAVTDGSTKVEALELGANDFLAKPVDPSELRARVRNILLVKAHQDRLTNYSAELRFAVKLRTAELAASRRDLIHCLAQAAECRDRETGNHVLRVGMYAGIIARQLGFDTEQVELIEQAAILHDVGKIGIADSILLKEGKLTEVEFEVMRSHCAIGEKILNGCSGDRGRYGKEADILRGFDGFQSPLLKMAASIAKTHHEKWDGSGYPHGLAGEEIALVGRITAVADVFDALSSNRSYKTAFDLAECFDILREGRGTHFDPTILDAFMAREEEAIRVRIKYGDE